MISIIFDTETTGLPNPTFTDLEKQPHITEIGAIKVNGGDVVGRFEQLINPGVPLTAQISKITGLFDDDLEGQPDFAFVAPVFADFVRGADQWIAHNMAFDKQMMDICLKRHNVMGFPFPPNLVCTVQEARPIFGKYMKLIHLYEELLGKPLDQKHRAISDCEALLEVCREMGLV